MKFVSIVSSLVGYAGVLLCVLSTFVRLSGNYYFLGFEILTLFNAGLAVMIFGCFIKLDVLSRTLNKLHIS